MGPGNPGGIPGIPKGGGNWPGFMGGGGGAGAGRDPFGVVGFGVPGLSPPPLLSEPGPPEGFLVAAGAGVEEAEECPLLGLTGSFLWFTSPFSFGGGDRGRMPFWCTGDVELLLLLPV